METSSVSSTDMVHHSSSSSDGELSKKVKKVNTRSINLRERVKKNYKEINENDDIDNNTEEDDPQSSHHNKISKGKIKAKEKKKHDTEMEDDRIMNDQYIGIFEPDIELILWKKEKKSEEGLGGEGLKCAVVVENNASDGNEGNNGSGGGNGDNGDGTGKGSNGDNGDNGDNSGNNVDGNTSGNGNNGDGSSNINGDDAKNVKTSNKKKFIYLVKFKDYSYLHLKWMEEHELLAYSGNMKIRLSRFNKSFERKTCDMDETEIMNETCYFDPTYLEIDRVIYTTDLFAIIHPKKANEIKGKWSEFLVLITLKLLNFTKNNIHYGIYFMEPVDPDRDGIPNYKKLVPQPMDLGTLINRVYLDYYKVPQTFWSDLGLVFKNCRKCYKDPKSEIRRICDALREAAIELYKLWYNQTSEKYQKLIQDYQEHQNTKKKEPVNKPDEKQELKKQKDIEQKNKLNELRNLVTQFESFQKKNNLTLPSFKDTVKFKSQIKDFVSSSPELFKTRANIDEIAHIIISFSANPSLKNSLGSSGGDKSDKSLSNNGSSTSSGVNSVSGTNNGKKTQEELSLGPGNNNSSNPAKYEAKLSMQEIEQWNPGTFNFDWLIDERSTLQSHGHGQLQIAIADEPKVYLISDDIKDLDLFKDIDRLYLIKWKNLSYLDSTWEHESILGLSNKITEYYNFNRALDKESRIHIINQMNLHKAYLDFILNPKKYGRLTNGHIEDLKNKLYLYNISTYKKIFQYTISNQPVYKDRKLLRDYQLESLNWLIQAWYNQRNVILADEMGLGKTIQSIAFLNHLYNFESCKGPFLVLAPLSTLEHWRRTIDEWTNLNGVLYYDLNSIDGRTCCRAYEWFHIDVSTKGTIIQSTELYKFQILITSYEVFLQDLTNVFLNIPIQFIIVDEAHRLKNSNARILHSLKKLPCKRILLLTGTPIQNNTEELWSLLNYIEPDKFCSIKDFLKEFGDLSNAEQVERLHKVLKPYILRRKKEDVEASIPPLQETIIDVEMTTAQKTIYRALYERNKVLLSKGLSGASTNLNTSLNNLEVQLRKCCNHPFLLAGIEAELTKDAKTNEEKLMKLIESSGKMILLDKLLPKLKGEGKKVLIFSQFTYMLAILEDFLHFRGYKYEKIDGAVKSKERQNAIDRFNDPSKKRDIFLLSTKAGGLGINLTSANIVIIFDSDWNPQNDVQAAARAHRIGQKNEVQVYRLITAKTYESEMFERASKKLGLDQAIFMGGVFQSTNDDSDSKNFGQYEEGTMSKKGVTKHEIETLLKKGILGLLNDENSKEKSQKFMEENIDEILKKNTQLAKYSLINGTYTFSKSSFVSEKANANISINDPNFWELILKNTESTAKTLLMELDEKKDLMKDLEEQKKYMDKICDSIYKVIENKVNIVGYNADDEKNIMDILNKVSTSRYFHKSYRDIALNWIYELGKPSRKIKKPYIPTPSEIKQGSGSGRGGNRGTGGGGGRAQRRKKPLVETRSTTLLRSKEKNKEEKIVQSDDENESVEVGESEKGSESISIYNEGDDDEEVEEEEEEVIEKESLNEGDDEDDSGGGGGSGGGNVSGSSGNGNSSNNTVKKGRKYNKVKEDILKKPCCYCERVKCTISCQGYCKRIFHTLCKQKVEDGSICGLDDNKIDFDIYELALDEEKLKGELDFNYVCNDCQNNMAICFKCKKKGLYYSKQCRRFKQPPSKTNKNEGNNDDGIIVCEDGDASNENETVDKIKKKGSLTLGGGGANNNKMEIELEDEEEKFNEEMNELIKCSTANCNKFYHFKCVSGNPFFKFINADKHNKFRCSLHYCFNCKASGDNVVSVQCIRCPKAYHLKCAPKDKIARLTKKAIICQEHDYDFQIEKGDDSSNSKLYEKNEGNSNINKEGNKDGNGNNGGISGGVGGGGNTTNKGNSNNSGNNTNKGNSNNSGGINTNRVLPTATAEAYDKELSKIFLKKRKEKPIEKAEKKSKEIEQKIKKRVDLKIESNDDDEDSHQMNNTKSITQSNKIKKRVEIVDDDIDEENLLDSPKELTYSDLNIDPPELFDYSEYNEPWCRYCGARYSRKFSKGPWGSKTLCAVHSRDWQENKLLSIKAYKDPPSAPIKPGANTELIYLQETKVEDDMEYIPENVEEFKPRKKKKLLKRKDDKAINIESD